MPAPTLAWAFDGDGVAIGDEYRFERHTAESWANLLRRAVKQLRRDGIGTYVIEPYAARAKSGRLLLLP